MSPFRILSVGVAMALAGIATGCALPARLPVDPPLPSGGARWVQHSATAYAVFVRGNWDYGKFTADDRLQWSRLADPNDEVWRWTSPAGQAGYALVREGRVLTIAITDWGMRGK